MKLSNVIEALVEEKGLDGTVLKEIVCNGVLDAYQKRYPECKLRVYCDEKSGELVVQVEKIAVNSVVDEEIEISIRKAKALGFAVEAGEKVWVSFDGTIGRIEIMRARQLIASEIRQVEASTVYDEFKPKEGHIIQGVVHKNEKSGVSIKVQGDYLAFLPKSLSVPGERFTAGFPIKALLKEVLELPRNENQLILDRVSSDFLAKLFELEIPEVFERIVDIKHIVRIAGYKSKVIVSSNDMNVDPVGTCVGVGGARIKPILKDLGTEKIDIIAWTENKENLVKNLLKPAEINRVEVSDNNKTARVWLDDDQRSLAIGKMGQNIALASQLAGVAIDLVQLENREALDKKINEEF